MGFGKSSERKTSRTPAVHTARKVGFGFRRKEPRNPSAPEAKKRCCNSLVGNGVKCNGISVKKLSNNPPAVPKQATDVLVPSGKTHSNEAVSKSVRVSKTVDFKTEIDNLWR